MYSFLKREIISYRPLWFWKGKRKRRITVWIHLICTKHSQVEKFKNSWELWTVSDDSPSLSDLRGKKLWGKATVSLIFWRRYPFPAGQILLKATEHHRERISLLLYFTFKILMFCETHAASLKQMKNRIVLLKSARRKDYSLESNTTNRNASISSLGQNFS